MIDLANNLLGDFQDLITAAVGLIAIGTVIGTWMRSRSFVPTVGAIIFSALVLWAVHNFDFLEEQIGEDIEENSGAPALGAPPAGAVGG